MFRECIRLGALVLVEATKLNDTVEEDLDFLKVTAHGPFFGGVVRF
jgi:hypothetical protein